MAAPGDKLVVQSLTWEIVQSSMSYVSWPFVHVIQMFKLYPADTVLSAVRPQGEVDEITISVPAEAG